MAGEIQLNSTTMATESSGTITLSNVNSATNRQNLGLEIGVDVQQYDADTTKNDVANTFTANQIISVTDNTNAALRVTQLGTGDALVIEDSTNPDSTPFVVDASGNVGIGGNGTFSGDTFTFATSNNGMVIHKYSIPGATNTPSRLAFNGTSTGSITCLEFQYSGTQVGSIVRGTGGTSYSSASDYRLKENITEITDGISRVKQLNPSRFNFIADPENTVDGFIAHEVQDIVPEAISGEKDAVNEDGSIRPQGIDQSKLVPLLTAALQEAISKIDALTARIEALETT